MTAKKRDSAATRPWARTKGGNVKALFTISPEHEKALRDEALRRAYAVRSAKPDASAVLREILDGWLQARSK